MSDNMKLSVKEKIGYSLGDTASHFVWDMVEIGRASCRERV